MYKQGTESGRLKRLSDAIMAHDSAWAGLALFAVLTVVFLPVTLLGASLQSPLIYPSGITPDGAYGYDGRKPCNTFDVDLATPAYYEWPVNLVAGQAYRSGELPLWNPYQGIGAPLMAQYSSRVFFPYQVIIDLLPVSAWDYLFLGRLWIAGLFTILFLRRLQLSRTASLAGGVMFMLSGTFTWFINLEQLVNAAMVLPFLMFSVETCLEKPWHVGLPLVAAAVALELLAGQPETALFVLLLGTSYGVFRILRVKGLAVVSLLKLAAAGILGFALAAPLLIPFYEMASSSFTTHPSGGNMGIVNPTPLFSAVSIVMPSFLERDVFYRVLPDKGSWDYLGGYSGVVCLLLLVTGLVMVAKQRAGSLRGLFLFFLSAGLLVLLKNFDFPVVNWLGRLPLLDQAWSPRWAGPAWTFCLAAASAISLETVTRRTITTGRNSVDQSTAPESNRTPNNNHVLTGLCGLTLLAALIVNGPGAARWLAGFFNWNHGIFAQGVSGPYSPSAVATAVFTGAVTTVVFAWLVFRLRPHPAFAGLAVVLAVTDLWFAVPWGYDGISQLLKLIPWSLSVSAIIVIAAGRRRIAFALGLLAVAVFALLDLQAVNGLPRRYDPSAPAPYLSLLKEKSGYQRVAGGYGVLHPNFAAATGISDIRYVDALTDMKTYTYRRNYLHSALLDPSTPSALWFTGSTALDIIDNGQPVRSNQIEFGADIDRNLRFYSNLGVRYIVAPSGYVFGTGRFASPSEEPATRYRPLHQFPLVYDGEIKIYENPEAGQRAFVVHRVETAGSWQEAQEISARPGFDWRKAAVIENPAPSWVKALSSPASNAAPSSSSADIISMSFNTVAVAVKSPSPGLLVLADLYTPGWTADIDGRETEAVRVNGLFRGVPVEAGSHTVIFRYFPASLKLGLLLAVIAGLACIGMFVWGYCHGRKRSIATGSEQR